MFIIAIALAAASNHAVNKKVDIDGKTYRVETKGKSVQVHPKAIFSTRSPEAVHRMHLAVKNVTGCQLTEDHWDNGHLEGWLSCPSPDQPVQP